MHFEDNINLFGRPFLHGKIITRDLFKMSPHDWVGSGGWDTKFIS
jgi:hypothetical protein